MSQSGMRGNNQSGQSTASAQLTVSPVRNSNELTQLLKVVEAAAGGATYQVRPSGDGQSAMVSVSGGTTSGSALTQALQGVGFQILSVSVQGNRQSGGTGMQSQASGLRSGGGNASQQQGTGVVSQYTRAMTAMQNVRQQQATTALQYRSALQGMYRR